MRKRTLKAAMLAAVAGTVLQFGCLGGLAPSIGFGFGFATGGGLYTTLVAPLLSGLGL